MRQKLRNLLYVLRHNPVIHLPLVTAVVGVILVSLPPLGRLSYDLSYIARPRVDITNDTNKLVLVLIGDTTVEKLGDRNGLNRMNHARLLERLASDGAKLVFYDVFFDTTSDNPADQSLADAIKRQGSVILAARCTYGEDPPHHDPIPELCQAAAGCGHAELGEGYKAIRLISANCCCEKNSGVWVAAKRLAPPTFDKANPNLTRWLNYYGKPENRPIPRISFEEALTTNRAGFFKDKIVFVGEAANPAATIGGKNYTESFSTPYSLFGYGPMAGVDIHATALLNLLRNDWLRQIFLPWQWCAALLWGIAITTTLYFLSGKPKVILFLSAIAAAVLLVAGSLYVQWHFLYWWGWIGPAFGQTATALFLVIRSPKRDPYIAFISYRRQEDGPAALLISRSLAQRGLRTFIDVRSLESGKFDEQLLREIEKSTFFVPILSPRSLSRCTDPNDWVLKELTHALSLRKTIIPVLRQGFSFGPSSDVPDIPQIAELSRYHGVQYSDTDFEGFLDQLVAHLRGNPQAGRLDRTSHSSSGRAARVN